MAGICLQDHRRRSAQHGGKSTETADSTLTFGSYLTANTQHLQNKPYYGKSKHIFFQRIQNVWLNCQNAQNVDTKSSISYSNEIPLHMRTFLFNPLKPSGHYMHHQFNIQQLYVLPTQCICVFCADLTTNSDYFPIQH